MKRFLMALLFSTFMPVLVWGADLQWDYPSDWDDIIGYVVYFNEEGETDSPYTKNLLKSEVVKDGTSVTYLAVDAPLNLAYEQLYNFYITAYNDSGESLPSNIVSYTRSGYVPPLDSLPPPVVSSPQLSSGLWIN